MDPFRRLLSFLRRPIPAAGLVLVLLALGFAGRHFDRVRQFEQHRTAARQAEETFDFDRARQHFLACRELRPSDAGLRLDLARNTRRAGDYSAASAELDAYREMAGPTAEHTRERALLMAQQGDLPTVEEYLRTCLRESDPQTPLILEALARGCVHVYRLPDALDWVEQLLACQPGNVPGLIVRGMLHESAGKADEALKQIEAALEHQPANAPARLQLAQTLLRLKRPAEALPHLEWLQAGEHSTDVTLALARCCRLLGRHERAAELLDPLLAESPDDGELLAERGRAAMAADQVETAEDWLRRAVARMPADRGANYDLALCLQQRGKQSEADHYFQRAEEIHADLKRLAGAAERAMRSPNDPEPHWQAGLICLRNGQDRQGLRWLFGALQINPRHRPTHEALAAYYDRKGQADRAARHRLAATDTATNAPAISGQVP